MPIGFPIINGVRFDASSIELKLNTKRYIGAWVQYEQSLEPGEVRGLNPQVLGYTRGMYRVSGTLTILREEFQDLSVDLQTLAVGLLEANFACTITYSEVPPASIPTGAVAGTSTDLIAGMRFTGTRHQFSGGSADGITVEMPFVARYLLVNNFPALNALLKIATAATAP